MCVDEVEGLGNMSVPAGAKGNGDDLRILILTPSGRDARLAEQALARSGLSRQVCADLDQLRREITTGAGAVLIAGESLPRDETADPKVWIGPEPPWSSLPLVVLTGRATAPHFAALRRLEHRPKVTFLERPVPKRTLISTLQGAIEARRRQYQVRDLLAERARLHWQVEEQLNQLQTLYDSAPIGLALFDRELRFRRINAVLAEINGQTVAEHLGKLAWEIIPDLRASAEPLMQKVIDTGEPLVGIELTGETPAQPGVRRYWLEKLYPVKEPDGTVTGVGAIVEDVTERKRLERAQAILSLELQHRVKNILAKVQATATLTLKSSNSLEEFAESFSGRLAALVRAHDALFDNQWQPTMISALLRDALTPYLGDRQVPLCVADIRLLPERAFAFNLIIHELATNAAKYGALSVPEGRIQIDCKQSDKQTGMAIFRWTERGGPPAKPPRRHGFGSRLIEGFAKNELKGDVRFVYAPEGLECVIQFTTKDLPTHPPETAA
jgi:PAS domain S-box-containing protein